MLRRMKILAALIFAVVAQAQTTVTVKVNSLTQAIPVVAPTMPIQVTSLSCTGPMSPSAPVTATSPAVPAVPSTCSISLNQPAPAGGFTLTVYTATCAAGPVGPNLCSGTPVLTPGFNSQGFLVIPAGSSSFQFQVSLP